MSIALLALLAPVWIAPASAALGTSGDEAPQEQEQAREEEREAEEEAAEPASPADALLEELGRALGMTPDEGRGAGTVARGDAGPPRRLHGGDGGRRLSRGGAERHRVGGAGGRVDGHGPPPAGRRRSEGPAPDGHSVVQRQHAADRRRLDGGPAGHAPQPGARPHADPGQREAAPPRVDHRLARRATASRTARRRPTSPPSPRSRCGRSRVLRDGAAAQYGSDAIAGVMNFQLKDAASGGSLEVDSGMFGGGDGGNVPGGGQRRPAPRRPRVRQPEPAVRRVEPDQPDRPPQRRDRPDRRRQHERCLRGAADLGRVGRRGRPGALRELRLRPCPRASSSTPTRTTPARRCSAASSSATPTCSAESTATTTAAPC